MADELSEQSLVTPPGAVQANIIHALGRLTERVERSIQEDRFKEDQIRRLHAELQEYKRGLLDQAVLPILTQVVRLHENLKKQEQSLRKKPQEQLGPERLFKELASIRDEIEVMLSESGVAIFEHPAPMYDPSRQIARETVATTDPALHGSISERLVPGYERDGRLISKERVKVYSHRAGAAGAPAADPAAAPVQPTAADGPETAIA